MVLASALSAIEGISHHDLVKTLINEEYETKQTRRVLYKPTTSIRTRPGVLRRRKAECSKAFDAVDEAGLMEQAMEGERMLGFREGIRGGKELGSDEGRRLASQHRHHQDVCMDTQ